MSNVFFTADTHFNHKAIIWYCNRPYKSVEDMNESIVFRWNEVVRPNDTIYHLGDFSFRGQKYKEVLAALNGNIYLIQGNHDRGPILKDKRFKEVTLMKSIDVDKVSLVLCHYAMRVWHKSHYGSWQLYGHSHGRLADLSLSKATDVGVDRWSFKPVGFEEIRLYMDARGIGYGACR